LRIAKKLDEMAIAYIEGGWPGSNPKDEQFFQQARALPLQNAKIVAFGSTRRADTDVASDANVQALVQAGTPVVTIVGKSDALQVTHVLETTLEENLSMISDTVSYLKGKGKQVFFDAEHFFDGYKRDPDYALRALEVAAKAGADRLVLCDTNGGSLPQEVTDVVKAVRGRVATPLGIHAHNDGDLGVANTLAAVQAGAVQVQGTINGYGERCGNANLVSVIANLKLKLGYGCLTDEQAAKLTETARYVSEVANLPPDPHQPYVGKSAFAHKGGIHASGVAKLESSYQHIDPAAVGNAKRILVSELAGRSNLIAKAKEFGVPLSPKGPEIKRILDYIKLQESRGFEYESAEASFELILHRASPSYKQPFALVDFMVVVEKHRRSPAATIEGDVFSEATVKVKVDDEIFHTAAEGNGPVNALDAALRKALARFYPEISQVQLTDYKVRIVDGSGGTGASVRVLVESSADGRHWRTVGCSTNIIEASWLAVADSLEYWLLKR
ncbi:MAG: citramalate synthase, partial [Chloroflexi bacterium]|nr:citramalate synthase [Chloroflexota bacterium]